jgi:ribosome biogenesis GTPase
LNLIIKNTGSECWVQRANGNIERCKIRGNLRLKNIKSTNPVAVGDKVVVDSSGFITEILDRKNYIIRRPTNLSKQIHIIAANIDVAILVVTFKQPQTSVVFIDRFITSAEAFDVPVVLIFNKIDLLDDNDLKKLEVFKNYYQQIGYQCIITSKIENKGIDDVKEVINGKVALLAGNSGVGKSTIINSLLGTYTAKTAKISAYHLKGMHTTTFSEIFFYNSDTMIIDTPGIKGFGLVDIKKNEAGHYFVEIFKEAKHCRYPNCTHIHEPDCAVLKSVANGKIAEWRYKSYISVLEDNTEGKYRK